MEVLLEILIYILVIGLLLLIPRKSTVLKNIFISIGLGILLAYLTLFRFNQHPVFLDNEANAIKILSEFSQHTLSVDKALKGEKIVLIDVAPHPQLIENRIALFNDSTAQVAITNRTKLADLFNWLSVDSVQSKIGMVVCDVLLEDATLQDDSLYKSMNKLIGKDKLLLAKRSDIPENSEVPFFKLDRYSSRSVEILEYDGMYFSHALLSSDSLASLPYEMYLRRTGASFDQSYNLVFKEYTDSLRTKKWVNNWFIPDLIITEEDLTGKQLGESDAIFDRVGSWFLNLLFGNVNPSKTIREYPFLPIGLGAAAQAEGQSYIMDQLCTGMDSSQRTTVFIGSFSDERDMHETAFGTMHGGLIIINIYLNLMAKNHQINILYVIFLWICYSAIVYIPVSRINTLDFNKNRSEGRNRSVRIGSSIKLLQSIFTFLKFFVREVFLDELHYWLLILVFIISAVGFHHLVNVMGLIIVLAAIDFAIRGIREAIESSDGLE